MYDYVYMHNCVYMSVYSVCLYLFWVTVSVFLSTNLIIFISLFIYFMNLLFIIYYYFFPPLCAFVIVSLWLDVCDCMIFNLWTLKYTIHPHTSIRIIYVYFVCLSFISKILKCEIVYSLKEMYFLFIQEILCYVVYVNLS